ncbi:hypothetical protein J2T12_000898 [Paenibacillus anaericanus]|uniref:hypothetical protein n=1 Tax=Paenibacillus anaericanus TaxID=170367 RepID=UPI0027882DA0|nr:hypothetical protein [Paenibacillus anaericanus]MDQ0087504.1 hypothetical protein [Paenibacillus anaericanus]
MTDNLEKALIVVAELFLFITACIFTINGINSQEAAIETFRRAAELEDRRLFTSLEVNGRETYTGAEVLQSIYQIHSINADIWVEGIPFLRGLNIETTNVSVIDLQRTYDVEYIRDGNGVLKTIVFT